MSDQRPIGVFDSGVGGLTVLREILRRLPYESTVYLGDNARAPYGTRDDDEVRRFSVQALDALVRRDVKALVVACNTSTSVALGDFRRRYDLPVLGVVRPGAAAAALATRNRRVGVIATPATVRSRAYFNAIKDENPAVEVYEHATPGLVPLVEAGRLTGPEVEAAVRRAVAPLLGERDGDGDFIFPLPPSARIDTLLLGCTHYPLLLGVLRDCVGDGVAIVDFGHRDGLVAGRAAFRQRPGGARHDARHGCRCRDGRARAAGRSRAGADTSPADDRRRCGVSIGGRANVRGRLPGDRRNRS